MPKVTNETAAIVEGFPPIDTTGNAQAGNAVSLKNASHLTIIIKTGAWAGGATGITLQQSTSVAEGDGKALAFSAMWTNSGGNTSSELVKTTVVSNTFDISVAASMYIIEVDVDTLDVSNNFDVVSVQTDSPGANADLIDATYLLSQTRFLNLPNALAD